MLFVIGCQSQSEKTGDQTSTTNQTQIEDLNIDAFLKGVKTDPNAVLLDVRTDEEVSEGVIPGAQVIDYYGDDFNSRLAELDRSKAYYLYCRSGNRSRKAAEIMKQMGFSNLYNLDGGYESYEEHTEN